MTVQTTKFCTCEQGYILEFRSFWSFICTFPNGLCHLFSSYHSSFKFVRADMLEKPIQTLDGAISKGHDRPECECLVLPSSTSILLGMKLINRLIRGVCTVACLRWIEELCFRLLSILIGIENSKANVLPQGLSLGGDPCSNFKYNHTPYLVWY